jgi:hypothetical protein
MPSTTEEKPWNIWGMSQMKTNPEFAPIPSYTQSSVSNASWVNVTLTKIDPDGSTTQVFFLAKK